VPQLSVVIWSADGSGDEAVESVLRSAEEVAANVQVVVARNARATGTTPTGATQVNVLPLGSAYARNRGFEVAEGDVIAFLDGHMRVSRGWIAAILAEFESLPWPPALVGPIGSGSIYAFASRGGNVAFARSGLQAVAGFDHAFGVDHGSGAPDVLDAILRLRRAGHPERLAVAMRAEATSRRGTPAVAAAFGRVSRRHKNVVAPGRYLAGLLTSPRRLVTTAAHVARSALWPPAETARVELLAYMPPEIEAVVDRAALTPFGSSHRSKTHFLYTAPPDRVVHLYANPSERLRRAVREREAIRANTDLRGVPRLHAAAEGVDALWLLEDLIPGEQPVPARAPDWFGGACDWIVALAGSLGSALEDSPAWSEHAAAVVDVAPDAVRDELARALNVVSGLPAGSMHGDLQRHNIRLDNGSIGVVDWEGAWRAGIRGLDLVFCSLLAEGDEPDPEVITSLTRGGDHPSRPLRPHLQRLGIPDDLVRELLLVCLGTWLLGERRRLTRLGGPPPAKSLFYELLLRCAPELSSSR